MNSPKLRALVFGALLLCLAIPGQGAPGVRTVPLRLATPDLTFIATEGGPVPALAGFGTTSRPGEPALPLRILLVAIPEGATPTLTILSADSETVADLDVAPVPSPRVQDREEFRAAAEEDGPKRRGPGGRAGVEQTFRRAPAAYGRDAFFPAAPLRLGNIGALREQTFVEVYYTPLMYNPVTRQGRLYRNIEAVVTFAEPDTGAAAAASEDPAFEATYRASLVNYEQSRSFRSLRRGGRPWRGSGGAPGAAGTIVSGAQEIAAAGVGAEAGVAAAASAGPRFKISVSQRGLYRLDFTYLNAHARAGDEVAGENDE